MCSLFAAFASECEHMPRTFCQELRTPSSCHVPGHAADRAQPRRHAEDDFDEVLSADQAYADNDIGLCSCAEFQEFSAKPCLDRLAGEISRCTALLLPDRTR